MIRHLSWFSQVAREKVSLAVALVLLLSSSACATERPALVTQSDGAWQHQYEVESGLDHEGILPPTARTSPLQPAHALQPEPEALESTREQIVRVVSDVLAFPFRGVGWVIQKIF